ncbi:DUF721 domain-containing protein [bacterium]|nr:DUF721 domain-containing protein [bacterium]
MWETSGIFLKILLIWEEVTGKSNAKLMIPTELKQKILKVAVPNNIVISAVSKFERLMVKRINSKFDEETVLGVRFFIDPSQFKRKKSESKPRKDILSDFSQEEISQKKQELIQSFNLNGEMAEIAASIELLREKNNIPRSK